MTFLDAVKTRERNRRKRAGLNWNETERNCTSEGIVPGREAGSIPGGSTRRAADQRPLFIGSLVPAGRAIADALTTLLKLIGNNGRGANQGGCLAG